MLVLAICFCARPRPCDGPIAIFPPVPSITTFCSIGDRAIVVSALHEVRRRCPNAATVVVGKVLPVAGINFTTVTIKRWHQGVAQEASAIIVLATDMLDGRWGGNRFEVSMLNIAQAADARGTPFAAISFTYASSVNAVHSIEHFPASSCLRPRSSASCVDVRSRIEAEAGTATNCSYPVLKTASALRSAHLRHTMDLAFLLPQTSPPAGDKAWLDDQLRSGVRTVLGVNLFVYPSIRKTGFQKLAQTYAGELCAAHQTNHLLSVLLVAHDFRKRMGKDYEHEGLYMLHVQLWCARLCPSFPVHVFNEGQPYEPTQSKAAIARVHGVVSGLMHFLIISAGAGTPGLALTPVDKFYELYDDLYGGELARALIVRRASKLGELRDAISRFVILLDRARAILAASLPRVRRMSGWNLDVLELQDGRCVAGIAGPCV